MLFTRDARALRWLKKYLRFADYMGVAQLYLRDNFLLRSPLSKEHLKKRILGHWGTVPGLNFIYAHLNYLICKHDSSLLLITGPGHGAPAILANLYLEKTLNDFYPGRFPHSYEGLGRIIKDFSWPHSGFPSHVTPGVPGSILEGGELGYSLSTAFGSVLDNPDLITAVIIGDGEAESGPLAAAWNSNKFLNPKTSGAVLPIVHVNGYKISNPTILGTMSDTEIINLFVGYGYNPKIVSGAGDAIHRRMMKALESSYQEIRALQKRARRSGATPVLKPRWPALILRTPKGWHGIHDFKGELIEGSYRSHGIPLEEVGKDETAFKALEKWLSSYKIQELTDEKGAPLTSLLKFVPQGEKRMGCCPQAVGGKIRRDLKLPALSQHEIKVRKRGAVCSSSMENGGRYLRDVFRKNPSNFRLFCPDEVESNKLGAVFEATKRAYQWPLQSSDTDLDPEGRVMEMLSEHTLNGWLQGYLLTGRHGVFVSYEAFTTIISSMVDQYAKFLKQSFQVSWRKPLAGAVYLLSSVGWRQEHNGYSHQNPSFVSNILQKHGEFSQIYYPVDSNSFMVVLEETLSKKDGISVIVAGKRPLPQWLTMKEAKEQAKYGVGIWEWVGGKEACRKPDVILASAGDYITVEALMGAKICRQLCPELQIRYVNVSELSGISLGDYCTRFCRRDMTPKKFEHYFTKDRPVVFNYHGYVSDVQHILWENAHSERFSIHGYTEEGSTTTPFDMAICNHVSRYHIAIDLLERGAQFNRKVAARKAGIIKSLRRHIEEHRRYIDENGDDPEHVKKVDLTF